MRRKKPEPLRTGLVVVGAEGSGWLNKGTSYDVYAEVEEWETLGELSRITIQSVSGVPRSLESEVRARLGSWVPTDAVVWRES